MNTEDYQDGLRTERHDARLDDELDALTDDLWAAEYAAHAQSARLRGAL